MTAAEMLIRETVRRQQINARRMGLAMQIAANNAKTNAKTN